MSENESVEVEYDERHGGAWDRGSADSWYRRGINPHYYVNATGSSELIKEKDMTVDEINAYIAGFAYNEANGDHKW